MFIEQLNVTIIGPDQIGGGNQEGAACQQGFTNQMHQCPGWIIYIEEPDHV
jgi:hypothetical protein